VKISHFERNQEIHEQNCKDNKILHGKFGKITKISFLYNNLSIIACVKYAFHIKLSYENSIAGFLQSIFTHI